jgi:hypothetical protein
MTRQYDGSQMVILPKPCITTDGEFTGSFAVKSPHSRCLMSEFWCFVRMGRSWVRKQFRYAIQDAVTLDLRTLYKPFKDGLRTVVKLARENGNIKIGWL